jgi:hypothetical protein
MFRSTCGTGGPGLLGINGVATRRGAATNWKPDSEPVGVAIGPGLSYPVPAGKGIECHVPVASLKTGEWIGFSCIRRNIRIAQSGRKSVSRSTAKSASRELGVDSRSSIRFAY